MKCVHRFVVVGVDEMRAVSTPCGARLNVIVTHIRHRKHVHINSIINLNDT